MEDVKDIEEMLELLVEIAALEHLRYHWSFDDKTDDTNQLKSEILERLLGRKRIEREERLRDFEVVFPEISGFNWPRFDA